MKNPKNMPLQLKQRMAKALAVKATLSMMLATATLHAAEYHVSLSGNDMNEGSAERPFKTISKAAEIAQPGDVITVHEGVYRERINPPRGGESDARRITYQAAPGEKVVIKGSERVTGWKHVEDDTWAVTLPNSFFGDFNPYSDLIYGDWFDCNRPFHTGAVYLNGHWLTEAGRKSDVLKSQSSGNEEDQRPEMIALRALRPWPEKGRKETLATQYVKASKGISTTSLPDGDTYIGRMRDGDTLTYELDLGEGNSHIYVWTASPVGGSRINLHLDTPEGELLGVRDVGFTAEWHTFQPYRIRLRRPITGKHTVVMVFEALERKVPKNLSYWFGEVNAESTTIWAQFKGVDPNEAMVEINVRQAVIYPEQRHRNYITVKGFTLEQAATPWSPPTAEQIGLIGTHWSKGWIIEDNIIRYSTCAGVTLGKFGDEFDNKGPGGWIPRAFTNGWTREDIGHHLVRNNRIYNCGQAGIVGSMGCSFSTITGNEVYDIRQDHDYGGCETAGIKLHGFVDGIISDNHIYNCLGWGGIWLDWMGQGSRLTRNLIHDCEQDLMFEMNHGPYLVDNNILLSNKTVTKASGSGAYAQNLWTSGINTWPDTRRTPPYFKPHSLDIIDESGIDQNDDRYYNNLFVGGTGTAKLDEDDFTCTAVGNVYLDGAKPSKSDKDAIEAEKFNPGIKLEQKPDGWWLEMKVDPSWHTQVNRPLVTTKLLGQASYSKGFYEHPDGKPYSLTTDYFGNQRDTENPSPGPFRLDDKKVIRLKVWPKD